MMSITLGCATPCWSSCKAGAATRRPPNGWCCTRTRSSTGSARPRRASAGRWARIVATWNSRCRPATGWARPSCCRPGNDQRRFHDREQYIECHDQGGHLMRRPGIDAELVAPLAEIKALMPPLTLEGLSQLRELPSPPVESLLEGRDVEHEELEVPGPDGTPDVK